MTAVCENIREDERQLLKHAPTMSDRFAKNCLRDAQEPDGVKVLNNEGREHDSGL